jgi:hypothetical protein
MLEAPCDDLPLEASRLAAEVDALIAENGCLTAALAGAAAAAPAAPAAGAAGAPDADAGEGGGGAARLAALEQRLAALRAQAEELANDKKAADAAVAALASELINTRQTANMVLYRLLEEMQKSMHGAGPGGAGWGPGHALAMPYAAVNGGEWGQAAMAAMQMQVQHPAMQMHGPAPTHAQQPAPPARAASQGSGGSDCGAQQAQRPGTARPAGVVAKPLPGPLQQPQPQQQQQQQQASQRPQQQQQQQQQQQPSAKKARSRDEVLTGDQMPHAAKRPVLQAPPSVAAVAAHGM